MLTQRMGHSFIYQLVLTKRSANENGNGCIFSAHDSWHHPHRHGQCPGTRERLRRVKKLIDDGMASVRVFSLGIDLNTY